MAAIRFMTLHLHINSEEILAQLHRFCKHSFSDLIKNDQTGYFNKASLLL